MKLLLFAIVVSVLMCPDAKASSLFGKVIEVNSGDVITVFNLNRPVRVRLLGVDAPELNQPFGDVARKHLADLVFDQSVLVEYSGIGPDSSLSGRVLLGNTDIGAQMIRDGAAWVDPGNQHRLSATDREVYQQSEQAARSERRGLWQDENPIAPWEFMKALALRRNPVAALNAVAPATKPKSDKPASELTNLTLIASRMAAAAPQATKTLNSSDLAGLVSPTERGNWRLLRPARESFSVLVPEAGETKDFPVPGNKMMSAHAYRGGDGWSWFGVVWLTGPTYGEPDSEAINTSLRNFLEGFGQSYRKHTNPGQHPTFSCELQNEKDISMSGFTGLEFDLPSCTIPTKARAFTRTIDGDRQMYIAIAFYLEEDDNVTRFLNSFTITQPGHKKAQKAQK